MLQSSTPDSPPLDTFCSSPVRGQLEAYDPKTPKGWRYIQTTDTPNQLKILLPPGTASMYEQLLKFEVFELRKKAALSWERILEIRHLKDRMIRKCHKLAKDSSLRKPSDPLTFQTIIAPSDFRVNAMERWFQQQQKRTNAFLQRNSPSSNQHSRQLSVPSNEGKRLHVRSETRFLPQPSRLPHLAERSASLPTRPALPRAVPPSSPPPLPHLLRIRNPETGYDLSADPQKFVTHPLNSNAKDLPLDDESSSIPPKQDNTPRPEIRRRRSCIKGAGIGDLVKTVSWADDGGLAEQVSKCSSANRDVHASGRKWEEIRDIFVGQMAGLELLQQEVEKSLEHIRSESEHLMRTDETLRRQRSILQLTFQELERKQTLLQAKGKYCPLYYIHFFQITDDL